MSDKFLNVGGLGTNLTNGSANLYVSGIGVAGLDPSKPIKTNSTRQLVSTNLDVADVNNLQTQLTEKDELTFIEDDTHTAPAQGSKKLYVKTDGKLYLQDFEGSETEVGSGGAVDSVIFNEENTQTDPDVNQHKLYFKTDDRLYQRDNVGTESEVSKGKLEYEPNSNLLSTLDANSGAIGNDCINIGYLAGNSNLTGERNTQIGKETGFENVAGNDNTVIGNLSFQNIQGSNNVAIGSDAQKGTVPVVCDNNTSVGYKSLESINNSTAQGNCVLGAFAGSNITSGSVNTIIGGFNSKPLTDITTEQGNVILGYEARINNAGVNNSVALGRDTKTTQNQQMMVGSTNATIGINQIVSGIDDFCDLGTSSNRFKQAHLSDSVFTPDTTYIHGNTRTTPSAGNSKLYFKTDGLLYKMDSGGTETEVGSSGAVDSVIFNEQNTQTNPGANQHKLYFKTDGVLYQKDELGTESEVSKGRLEYDAGTRLHSTLEANAGEGTDCINIGYTTGLNNASGQRNINIGNEAGLQNIAGNDNTVIGNLAFQNIQGSYNVAIGSNALKGGVITVSSNNTAVGYKCLESINNISAINNVAIGAYSGSLITSGSKNVIISGFLMTPITGVTTEQGNTLLGYSARINSAGINNSIALGQQARTTQSQQMLVGSTTASNSINQIVAGIDDYCDLGSLTKRFKQAHLSDSVFTPDTTYIHGNTRTTPSAGNSKLYFKTDGLLYKMDSGGTETNLEFSQSTNIINGTTKVECLVNDIEYSVNSQIVSKTSYLTSQISKPTYSSYLKSNSTYDEIVSGDVFKFSFYTRYATSATTQVKTKINYSGQPQIRIIVRDFLNNIITQGDFIVPNQGSTATTEIICSSFTTNIQYQKGVLYTAEFSRLNVGPTVRLVGSLYDDGFTTKEKNGTPIEYMQDYTIYANSPETSYESNVQEGDFLVGNDDLEKEINSLQSNINGINKNRGIYPEVQTESITASGASIQIKKSIIPDQNNQYDLGAVANTLKDAYINKVISDSLILGGYDMVRSYASYYSANTKLLPFATQNPTFISTGAGPTYLQTVNCTLTQNDASYGTFVTVNYDGMYHIGASLSFDTRGPIAGDVLVGDRLLLRLHKMVGNLSSVIIFGENYTVVRNATGTKFTMACDFHYYLNAGEGWNASISNVTANRTTQQVYVHMYMSRV